MTAKKGVAISNSYNPYHEQEQPPLVDLALYNVLEPKRKSPQWVREEQLVYGGNNETLFFFRRTGGTAIDIEEDFAY